MNIGFFTDTYFPQVDGVVISINLFRRELEKRGHTVYIFAPHSLKGSKVDFKQEEKEDPNVFRFRSLDSIFVPGYPFAIPISFKASRKIPKLKLDIVHAQSYSTLGLLGDLVALTEKIPKVFTYHTFYSEYAKDYIFKGKIDASKVVQKYDVFYCNRCDRVITPSVKLKDILEQFGVKSQITVLPTGIDLEEFEGIEPGGIRKELGIPEDKKVLLFVGRLGVEKNVEFLIRMMNVLLRKKDNVVMVIVGDGKNKKDLEKVAKKLDLENQVYFTGFLERVKTLQVFATSDVFVFASKTDTQGLVLLEAAAMGKPVVMIKDEGLGNLVVDGENGFTVPDDREAFARKTALLLQDNELYARMSSNSRAKAKSLSIERQTDKLLKLYSEVQEDYLGSSRRIKFWLMLQKDVTLPTWLRVDKKISKLFKKSHGKE